MLEIWRFKATNYFNINFPETRVGSECRLQKNKGSYSQYHFVILEALVCCYVGYMVPLWIDVCLKVYNCIVSYVLSGFGLPAVCLYSRLL